MTARSSSEKLRVGVIGCGAVVRRVHLRALARVPSIDVVAISDTNEECLTACAALAPAARRFDAYERLLEAPDIDAVVVALPNPLHAIAATRAFERGLHVYLEKPLAVSVAEAQSVLRAWRAAGTVGMIGFNYRFGPLAERVRALLRGGAIGDIGHVRSVFATASRALSAWKEQRATGGGALLDLASHHLDLIPWSLEQHPSTLSASIQSRRTEHDSAALRLTFGAGATAEIFASLGSVDEHRVEWYGTDGKLVIDLYRSDRVEYRGPTANRLRISRVWDAWRALASPRYWGRQLRREAFDPSYARAFDAFHRATQLGGPVVPDLDAGLRVMMLIEAAEAASRDGRTIDLSEVK